MRLFQNLQDRLCKAMRLQGIDDIEQANSWLPEYLREHNRRFAVAPAHLQDMHRPWGGTPQALARICALHHQRQLSAQGAYKLEGQFLQLQPGRAHAPKARAVIDIAQQGDGSLELSYCGHALAHRSFGPWEGQFRRQRGIFKPDTPPIMPPRAGAAHCGLRPAHSAPRGHFYFRLTPSRSWASEPEGK